MEDTELLQEIKKLADNKTDLDFLKQQMTIMHRNVEGSFQNVAQGHNELFRMIQVLTHALINKGILTEAELNEAGAKIAEQAAKEVQEELSKRKGGPALVTADGSPVG